MNKQPKPKLRPSNEALWTRIQGRAGIYRVQRAAEDAHRVEVQDQQPICDCPTYQQRVAQRRTGKGAACPHIAALRDCGFIAA